MLRPLTLVITSPGLRPACSPGLCGSTALINAPCGVDQTEGLRELLTDVLDRHADAAAVHLAGLHS